VLSLGVKARLTKCCVLSTLITSSCCSAAAAASSRSYSVSQWITVTAGAAAAALRDWAYDLPDLLLLLLLFAALLLLLLLEILGLEEEEVPFFFPAVLLAAWAAAAAAVLAGASDSRLLRVRLLLLVVVMLLGALGLVEGSGRGVGITRSPSRTLSNDASGSSDHMPSAPSSLSLDRDDITAESSRLRLSKLLS
jgi:hypothetical protein